MVFRVPFDRVLKAKKRVLYSPVKAEYLAGAGVPAGVFCQKAFISVFTHER